MIDNRDKQYIKESFDILSPDEFRKKVEIPLEENFFEKIAINGLTSGGRYIDCLDYCAELNKERN
jgi:hypothetical protein